jgi:hypothetical protein
MSPEQTDNPDHVDHGADLQRFAEGLAEQTESRSTSGTVRRRRRVVRGTAGLIPEDDGPEFVRVRSSAEETRQVARLTSQSPDATDTDEAAEEYLDVESTEDPITPDQVTATSANSGLSSGPKVSLDGHASAMLIDAVRNYLEGYDRLGGEHPVTLDRLDRVRRVVTLLDDQ